MRPTVGGKPTVQHVKDDSGEVQIIDGKKEIHEKEIQVTQNHMGKDRERWYTNGEELLPMYADN